MLVFQLVTPPMGTPLSTSSSSSSFLSLVYIIGSSDRVTDFVQGAIFWTMNPRDMVTRLTGMILIASWINDCQCRGWGMLMMVSKKRNNTGPHTGTGTGTTSISNTSNSSNSNAS